LACLSANRGDKPPAAISHAVYSGSCESRWILNGGELQARIEVAPNAKAIRAGKPGDRFDNASFPDRNLEILSVYTGLLTDAQLFNDLLVSFRVTPFKVFQMPFAPTHHVQQSTPRSMVLTMGTKMLVQVADSLTEQRNLYFG
jgi:hypothetical protein